MSIEQWTATPQDADRGHCLPEQVGATFAGPRPEKPVYWTVWDSFAGRCSPEQVGCPRPPSEGGSKVFPQATAAAAPAVRSEYGGESGGEASPDEEVERLLAAAANLHLQSPEEQRAAQLQYLNLGIAALLPRVSAGDRLSMETMVRLQARVASISGLDQPRIRNDRPAYQTRDIPRLSDEDLMIIAAGGIVYRETAE